MWHELHYVKQPKCISDFKVKVTTKRLGFVSNKKTIFFSPETNELQDP